MVRQAIAISLCGWLSAVALAQTAPPAANAILDEARRALPGYQLPWEIDAKIRRYKSEAEWRKEHPTFREQAAQMLEGLGQVPDAEWQQMAAMFTEQMKQLQTLGVGLGSSALTASAEQDQGALMIVFEAMRQSSDRKSILRVLRDRTENLTDDARIELAKIERPDLVAKGDESSGAATIKITLEIWSDAYLRDHAGDIDIDDAELQTLAANTTKDTQAMIDALLPTASQQAEEELARLYARGEPQKTQEAIDRELRRLNGLASFRLTVEPRRVSVGDAGHMILTRGADPDAGRPFVQGVGQMRRGRAVFKFDFRGVNSYANEALVKQFEQVLGRLAERAAPFDANGTL